MWYPLRVFRRLFSTRVEQRCSFCEAPTREVQHLIAGLNACICDCCVLTVAASIEPAHDFLPRALAALLISRGNDCSASQRRE